MNQAPLITQKSSVVILVMGLLSGRWRSEAQRDRAFRARRSVVAARMLLHQGPKIRDARVQESGRLRRRRRRPALRSPPLRLARAGGFRAGHDAGGVSTNCIRINWEISVVIVGIGGGVFGVEIWGEIVGFGESLGDHAHFSGAVVVVFPQIVVL